MNKRQKSRWMKFIVATCIVTLISMFIAAFIAYWHGIDMDTWLTLGCGAFSLELTATACLKLFGKDEDKKTDPKKDTNKVNG